MLLFLQDGQTLGALEARFSMTRFGVMRHLALLEQAGLVVSRRSGRQKLQFLNPVPMRTVHDRWVSKYAEPWAAGLSGCKTHLEDLVTTTEPDSNHPIAPMGMVKVFELYIPTTPERLWEAITNSDLRSKYQFGVQDSCDLTTSGRIEASHPGTPGLLSAGLKTWLETDTLLTTPGSLMYGG